MVVEGTAGVAMGGVVEVIGATAGVAMDGVEAFGHLSVLELGLVHLIRLTDTRTAIPPPATLPLQLPLMSNPLMPIR